MLSADCFVLWFLARKAARKKSDDHKRRVDLANAAKRRAKMRPDELTRRRETARAVYAAKIESRRAVARAKMAKKRATPEGKLEIALRRRLYDLARRLLAPKKKGREDATMELIGCTVEFLREYLEQRFRDGMTWENYGSRWHIDHIRPCASFDLMREEERRACFHFTNLQPLWAYENLIKGDRWA